MKYYLKIGFIIIVIILFPIITQCSDMPYAREIPSDKNTQALVSSVTPLMKAVSEANVEEVEKLLEKPETNVNNTDAHGKTALFYAASNVDIDKRSDIQKIVQKLLKVKGIEVDKADIEGLTPLAVASLEGNIEVVQELLKACAKKNSDKCPNLETRDKKVGYTPLMRAAQSGHEEIVKSLLERGASPISIIKRKDKETGKEYYVNALTLAQSRDHKETKNIIESSLKPYTQRAIQFIEALMEDRPKLKQAQTLLELGINVNAQDESGWSPLAVAAKIGNKALVEQLLGLGASVNAKATYIDYTPMAIATKFGHIDVVNQLIKAGADINAKDVNGDTALHTAVMNNRKEIAQLLMSLGADVNAKDTDGYTPLHWAADRNNKPLIDLLMKMGGNIEIKDKFGRTPLAFATLNNREDAVELLVELGANVNTKDNKGNTPIEVATARGSKKIINILKTAHEQLKRNN